MGVEDNLFQISSLDQGDTFYDWFNKTNNEIIAKLNNIKVFDGLSGDGIDVLVGTTASGEGASAGDILVSISDSISKGVTFQGDVTINGILNYTSALNLPTGLRMYAGESGGTAGFTFGNAVRSIPFDGNVPGGTYGIGLTLADSSSGTNAEVVGLVSSVGSNYVDVIVNGNLELSDWSGSLDTGNTLTNCVYFLSTTKGKITKTEPNIAGLVSKPVLLGLSGDRGSVLHYRGQLLGESSGVSGASAGAIAVNSAIIDLSYGLDGFTLGTTQLRVGSAISKTRSTAITPNRLDVMDTEYTDPSTFVASNLAPSATAAVREIYGGYYLTSANDPDIPPMSPPDFKNSANSWKPSINDFVGFIKSFPGGEDGTLVEITLSGVFYPQDGNMAGIITGVNTNPGNGANAAIYVTPSNYYVAPTSDPVFGPVAYKDSAGQITRLQTSFQVGIPLSGSFPGDPVLLSTNLSRVDRPGNDSGDGSDPRGEFGQDGPSFNEAENGAMTFWQRGVLDKTANTADDGWYFADSWKVMNGIRPTNSSATGTFRIERKEFDLAQTEVLGSPEYYTRYTSTLSGVTGTTGGATGGSTGSTGPDSDFLRLENVIPDSQVASNTPYILSFYAKAQNSSTPINISYNQYFLDGSRTGTAFNEKKLGTISLGTSWQRYKVALQGVEPGGTKVQGDHYASIGFDLIEASGFVDLAQVILEKGNYASKPTAIDYNTELNRLKRRYQKSYDVEVAPQTATMTNPLRSDITPVVFQNDVTNTHYQKFDVSTRKVPSVQFFSPSSGTLGDALNLSATNSYEALDLRKTSGSKNVKGNTRTAITGNPTISSEVSKDGFVLDLLGGVLEGDKIAVHYVADADINKNFKRT